MCLKTKQNVAKQNHKKQNIKRNFDDNGTFYCIYFSTDLDRKISEMYFNSKAESITLLLVAECIN